MMRGVRCQSNSVRAAITIGWIALFCGVTGCADDLGGDQTAAAALNPPVRASVLPVPAFARAAAGGENVVIADVAERVVTSVVNIASEKIVRETGAPPEFGPFFNDPFFRYFFQPFGPGSVPRERREQSLGSGVIVSADGIVLTNNHVIENADEIRVSLSDGRSFDAEIVGRDPESDLGVLRLKGDRLKGLTPLPFGDSNDLRLGDVVLAVGNPFGVGQTVTMGIVSAKGRANVGIVEYEDFIQTDAAINPGNSGGALVNMRGELIGINTAILSRSGGYQGIGFAIPSNMARPVMRSILKKGKVERGWLGVAIQDLTPDLAEALGLSDTKGVLISDVTKDSPAEKAGLRRGDVVISFDGEKMDSGARLRNAVAVAGPGAEVTMEVVRDGKVRVVRVKLGTKEADGGLAQLGESAGAMGGLTLSEMTPELRNKYDLPSHLEGVVVVKVEPFSAAARAGFREGDVIVEINGQEVDSIKTFRQLYDRIRGTVAVLVQRGSARLYLAFRKSK